MASGRETSIPAKNIVFEHLKEKVALVGEGGEGGSLQIRKMRRGLKLVTKDLRKK